MMTLESKMGAKRKLIIVIALLSIGLFLVLFGGF